MGEVATEGRGGMRIELKYKEENNIGYGSTDKLYYVAVNDQPPVVLKSSRIVIPVTFM